MLAGDPALKRAARELGVARALRRGDGRGAMNPSILHAVFGCAAFAAAAIFCAPMTVTADEPAGKRAGAKPAAEARNEAPEAKADAPENEAGDLPQVEALKEGDVRKLIGRKAVVIGRVTNTHASEKGITFITLEGGKFTVVCWKESYAKFEGGSPATLYKGKTIAVTGDIFEYKGKDGSSKGQLEIKLREPSQVRIIEAQAPAEGEAARKPAAGKGGEGDAAEPKEEAPKNRVDAKKYFR